MLTRVPQQPDVKVVRTETQLDPETFFGKYQKEASENLVMTGKSFGVFRPSSKIRFIAGRLVASPKFDIAANVLILIWT